jgi:hypothetical protein
LILEVKATMGTGVPKEMAKKCNIWGSGDKNNVFMAEETAEMNFEQMMVGEGKVAINHSGKFRESDEHIVRHNCRDSEVGWVEHNETFKIF